MSAAAARATSTLSTNMSTFNACFFHLIQNLTDATVHFSSYIFLRTVKVTLQICLLMMWTFVDNVDVAGNNV